MTTMNYERFKHVAKWNFTINRAIYMKLSFSLFLAMSLPLLAFIMKTIWVGAITHNMDYALNDIPGFDMGDQAALCFMAAMPILCGHMFHNLLTKQDRIKELTLPASNGEKFLFHALVTVVGSIVVYMVSFLLIDILQYIYVGAIYGFSHARWIPLSNEFSTFVNLVEVDGVNHGTACSVCLMLGYIRLTTLMSLSGLMAYLSTFVLGNAIKYRHNVVWTYLFHFAVGFTILFALGLSMPWLASLDIKIDKIDLECFLIFLIVYHLLITVFCWWMSYRLYSRAQLTTRRNK